MWPGLGVGKHGDLGGSVRVRSYPLARLEAGGGSVKFMEYNFYNKNS